MCIVRNFIESPSNGGIVRARLEQLLEHGVQSGVFSDISERARFVKAVLGLLQELSYNRDTRMGFVEHSKFFLKIMF